MMKGGQIQSKELPDLKYIIKVSKEKTPGMLNFHELSASVGVRDISDLREVGKRISPEEPTNL